MNKYLKRRKKHSYNELWEIVYGDRDQRQGLLRDIEFAQHVCNIWQKYAGDLEKRNKSLRTKIERLAA